MRSYGVKTGNSPLQVYDSQSVGQRTKRALAAMEGLPAGAQLQSRFSQVGGELFDSACGIGRTGFFSA